MKEKVPVMKHIFILNPAAGKSDQTPRFTQDIERICGARGLDYEICVSKAPGDCRALARRAAESGQEVRLYACGGDGTLNEVVCGMAGFENAAVTHYPGGSGNDSITARIAQIFYRSDSTRRSERILRGSSGCRLFPARAHTYCLFWPMSSPAAARTML